jgi:glutaredoxin
MKKVRLYGFEGCPYCQELKTLMEDEGMEFDYIDIENDKYKDEVKKIMEIGKTDSVPIVLVNKVILSPEVSFKSIKEAHQLTKKFLNEQK